MLDRAGRGAGGADRSEAARTAPESVSARLGTGGAGRAAHAGLAEARGVLASAARSVGGEGAGEGVGGEAGRAVLREAAAELGRDLARLGARELGGLGDLLRAAFGAKAEGPAGRALGARLAAGEVPMPALRLVGDETLPAGARGAYSSQGEGTVFLHRDLMGDPAALRRVLAEELGHHLDRLLGGGDAKGDEGALFARLLAGERLGAGELAALRREDDRGRLRDGRAVELFSFGLGNASGGGLSFGGSATGGAGSSGLDVGAGGGADLGFGEGVGAVGRDALTSAEGLSMGTTGAGSEGTTVSSPRGELSLGERVSDDDGDGFRLGERIARGSGGPLAFGPGVPAAGRAETGLAAGGLRFGGPDGGAPDPAVAAMVDRAFRAAAEGLELGFEAVAGLARATARGLGTAAAVARGDPSAVLEAVEAVAGAVRAAPAKAGQLGEVVDRAVDWVAERRDPRAHDDRGLPTAAEWARRVADWAGLPVEAGLATVERGVELAQDIPAARTPLARELARGVASGAATGAVADKSLELALELDARAAVEAFNGEGGGGRLGRALADQGLRSRTQALGAIAEGSLTGLDRTGALTVVMRETRLERDLNGRDGRGGVAEAEESLRSSVAEALVAAHLPGLEGPEREAAVGWVEGALARRSVRRELGGLDELAWDQQKSLVRELATDPQAVVAKGRDGPGRPGRVDGTESGGVGDGGTDRIERPVITRTALTFGPDVSTLDPGSAATAGRVVLSPEGLAALDAAYGSPRGTGLGDDLRGLGRLALGIRNLAAGAAGLIVTPSLPDRRTIALSPDLRATGVPIDNSWAVERRIDGWFGDRWEWTGAQGVMEDGGLGLDGAALDALTEEERALIEGAPGAVAGPAPAVPIRTGGTLDETLAGLPLHTGSPAPAPPHWRDGLLADPVPETEGADVVTMDPNNPRAVRTQQEAADRMRTAFPDSVVIEETGFPPLDGFPDGDIDLIVGGVPVEVTAGRGRSKLNEQLPKIENATGEQPIVYAPRIAGTIERNMREAGYTVVRDLDALEEAVRDRMTPDER